MISVVTTLTFKFYNPSKCSYKSHKDKNLISFKNIYVIDCHYITSIYYIHMCDKESNKLFIDDERIEKKLI